MSEPRFLGLKGFIGLKNDTGTAKILSIKAIIQKPLI
jgi:hypothetical protein